MKKLSILAILLLAFVSVLGTVSAATLSATIDFEGLAEGAIVTSVSSGNGISGDVFGGFVGISGVSPEFAGEAAMIFDATCAGGCSGEDPDLFAPGLGNILIVTQDGDSSDPDDVIGGDITIDFSTLAVGSVDVASLTVVDTESGMITVYNSAGVIATIPLPFLEDGGVAVIPVNLTGVTSMLIDFTGSGAIDNVNFSVEEPDEPGGNEGCTPGYWKQPHHLDSWVGYAPSDSYDALFGTSTGLTLLEALNARGNRNGQAYLRHSTAALLNAASSVDYAYSEADILAGLFTKDELEAANEAGCPLN